jgi:hypothetical protein
MIGQRRQVRRSGASQDTAPTQLNIMYSRRAGGNRLTVACGKLAIQKDWRGIDLEVVRPSNEMGVPRESSWRLQAAGSTRV